ncbi:MAG: hypothetical protein MUE61_15390 [Vicinamibacterales bacterium]|nr:hypothetical protein [Vicinamibacterales bacterium]
MRRSLVAGLTLCLVLGLAAGLGADMKSRQKTQVKFEGMLGKMMGMFGGKSAKEGVVSTVAISGDRMMTVTGQSGELVDLAQEHRLQGQELRGEDLRRDAEGMGRGEGEDEGAGRRRERGEGRAA